MRTFLLMAVSIFLLTPALAEPVSEPVSKPEKQCPLLIDQVEARLQGNPPQKQESVEKARELLARAKAANKEGKDRECMENIREAFKNLNRT